jgi:hypothetical protein
MLKKLLHVHFVHDIKTVFSLCHVKDRLSHEFVQHQNVVLLLEEKLQSLDKVVLEQLALGNERVNLLLLNFPADSVDQETDLDRIVLRDYWIAFWFLGMKDILVDIDQLVHLLDRQGVEVLMDQEELHLVELDRIFDRYHQNIHHDCVHICLKVQIQCVDENSNLKRITFYANNEQLNELCVGNLILLSRNKLCIIIFLAIHLEHNEDIISCYKELLSVVLRYSWLHIARGDDDFLVVCLVVPSVG